MKNTTILFCGLISCLPGYILGYELETHATISQEATKLSVLGTNKKVLQNLGFTSKLDNLFFPNGEGEVKKLLEVIGDGARFEDNWPRFFNHFYDPIKKLGLYGFWNGAASPNWAIDEEGSLWPSSPKDQDFSLKDGRDYLYQALTLPNATEREKNFGLFFRTLGHVTHHIADMAQPQHTRNDGHAFGDNVLYEGYTEKVVDDKNRTLPYSGYAPVEFSQARNYWYTDTGQGLADYSNRGFVSADTNFDTSYYADPKPLRDNNGQIKTIKKSIQALFDEQGLPLPDGIDEKPQAVMEFVSNLVEDKYQPSSAINYRAASYSIFAADLEGYNYCDANADDPSKPAEFTQICKLYTLNRFNFDAAHKLLIPRAVGYGAGLINHFFRGKLEISLPDEGLYSVVDHATVNEIDQGFTTVKIKLKNVTPDVNDIPQNLSGGKLVLVAKYIRNDCYEPDLSGEYSKQDYLFYLNIWVPVRGNDCYNQRPFEKLISVSAAQSLPSVLAPQADPLTLTFDFSHQPIPLNATNLFLQVVYQGQLGQEEAVVVATKDIAEPTYLSIINSTDYFAIDGVYYHVINEIYPDPALKQRVKYYVIDPYSFTQIQIKSRNDDPILEMAALDEATYLRAALLVDREGFQFKYSHQTPWGPQSFPYQLAGRIEQDNSGFSYVNSKRGSYHWKPLYFIGSLDANLPDNRGIPAFEPENLAPKPVTIHFGTENENQP
ncbi:conserved hypothetical protein, secreted [Beggiatoa sp. PS]|nr:conserved hypothetical protein, secreted [Beggiatoa sp. PS]